MPNRRQVVGLLGLVAALPAQAGLVDIIADAKRSIAAVGSFNALDNPRFGFRGTGFVVGDGNLLVTNAHVLPPSPAGDSRSALVVQFSTEAGLLETRPATVAKLDATHDLALLRFEGIRCRPFGSPIAKDIHEGLSVAFIGFPIGGVLGFGR